MGEPQSDTALLLAFLKEQQAEDRTARQEQQRQAAALFEASTVRQNQLEERLTALDTERTRLAEKAAEDQAAQKEHIEKAKQDLEESRQKMQDAFDEKQAELLAKHGELAKNQSDILAAARTGTSSGSRGSSGLVIEKDNVGQYNSVAFPPFEIPATMTLSNDVVWDERDPIHASDPARLALAWRIVHSKIRDFFHELAPTPIESTVGFYKWAG